MPKPINMYFAPHKTCNLNCKYCYIPSYNKYDQKKDDRLAMAALERFMNKVETEGYRIDVFWFHGAEPTLLSADMLAKMINRVSDHKRQYEQNITRKIGMQTNGVNLKPDYLQTLQDNITDPAMFLIGFSIDPPKAVHDELRNNSYDLVMQHYHDALARGFSVSTLSVISRETIKNLSGFQDWITVVKEDYQRYPNRKKTVFKFATGELALSEDEMAVFAYFLLDNNLLKCCQSLNSEYCLSSGNNCRWLEIDVDGNCYPCNKVFCDEGIFANWHHDSIDEIYKKRQAYYKDTITHPFCKLCAFRSACNSSCPNDRHKSGIMAGKAHDCTLIRIAYTELQKRGVDLPSFFNSTSNFLEIPSIFPR